MHRDSAAIGPSTYRGQILLPTQSASIVGRDAATIDLYPGFDRPTAYPPVRPAKRRSKWPFALLWSILIVMALVAALLTLREPIVSAFPQLSTAYTAVGLPTGQAGLAFDDVRIVRVYARNSLGFSLDGAITNPTGRQVDVPPVTLTIRSSDGAELQMLQITPTRSVIDPGGTARFITDVAAAPAGAYDIALRLGDAPPTIIPIN